MHVNLNLDISFINNNSIHQNTLKLIKKVYWRKLIKNTKKNLRLLVLMPMNISIKIVEKGPKLKFKRMNTMKF